MEKLTQSKKLLGYARGSDEKVTDSRPSHKKGSGNELVKGRHVSDPMDIVANDKQERFYTSYKSEIAKQDQGKDPLIKDYKKSQQRHGRQMLNGKPRKNISDLPQ